MEEIFAIIGKLYLELLQSQKVIESLQKKLDEMSNLQTSVISTDN
jgi:hypothetical protein